MDLKYKISQKLQNYGLNYESLVNCIFDNGVVMHGIIDGSIDLSYDIAFGYAKLLDQSGYAENKGLPTKSVIDREKDGFYLCACAYGPGTAKLSFNVEL